MSTPTWSQPRRGSFQKAWKTGSQAVSLAGAQAKFSTGTSTLTVKFEVQVAGGYEGMGFMFSGGFGDY